MKHRTLDQIRQVGLTVLRRHLGRADMIRFMQQFDTGAGDYSSERHEWVDRTSLSDIKALSASARRRKKRSKKPRPR